MFVFLTLTLTILLFADDVVLISRTLEGLSRIFQVFTTFCTSCKLSINRDKTQVMAIGKGVGGDTVTLEDWTFAKVS